MTSCTTWRRTIHWRRLQKGINTWHRWKRRKSQNIYQHNTRDKRYLRKEFQLFLLYQACYRCSSLLKWDWFFNLANQNIANKYIYIFSHVFVRFSLKKVLVERELSDDNAGSKNGVHSGKHDIFSQRIFTAGCFG